MRLGMSCQLGNKLTDFNAYIILGLIEFQRCISQVRKMKSSVHIDHGSRPKAVELGWKSSSNNCQDLRKYWGNA